MVNRRGFPQPEAESGGFPHFSTVCSLHNTSYTNQGGSNGTAPSRGKSTRITPQTNPSTRHQRHTPHHAITTVSLHPDAALPGETRPSSRHLHHTPAARIFHPATPRVAPPENHSRHPRPSRPETTPAEVARDPQKARRQTGQESARIRPDVAPRRTPLHVPGRPPKRRSPERGNRANRRRNPCNFSGAGGTPALPRSGVPGAADARAGMRPTAPRVGPSRKRTAPGLRPAAPGPRRPAAPPQASAAPISKAKTPDRILRGRASRHSLRQRRRPSASA